MSCGLNKNNHAILLVLDIGTNIVWGRGLLIFTKIRVRYCSTPYRLSCVGGGHGSYY